MSDNNVVNLRAERERPYHEMVDRVQAIAVCDLCDSDGYRGARVCDHVDYREISARGHALASQALADAKARRKTEADEKQAANT